MAAVRAPTTVSMHLPVAPLNELPTRLLRFICAALAVDPQAFSKLYRVEKKGSLRIPEGLPKGSPRVSLWIHPHSLRPLKGNKHSQLLAVTWELLRPSTRLTTYYCD